MVIQLKDGGVWSIETNTDTSGGCPTCNYGATYYLYVYLNLEGFWIRVEAESEDGFGIPFSEVISVLAKDFSDMTQEEFAKYVENSFESKGFKVKRYESKR